MRMPGWCEKCHKIKQVRVIRMPLVQPPIGICAACEDEEDDRRKVAKP